MLSFYFWMAQLSLVGASNIEFAMADTSYFARQQDLLRTDFNPFTHTWSLGVEEQYYVSFPLLIALAYGPRRQPRTAVIGDLLMTPVVLRAICLGRIPEPYVRSRGLLLWCSRRRRGLMVTRN